MASLLPNDMLHEILNQCEIDIIFNIRGLSNLFNNYFLKKCQMTTNLKIEYNYRKKNYIFNIDDEEFNINNLDILSHFTSLKKFLFNGRFYENLIINTFINKLIKYNSATIESLYLYSKDVTVNWNLLTKFNNLTHLYINADMFYIIHDEDSDDEYVDVTYEYIDGSMDNSLVNLLHIFENTKLYHLKINGFYTSIVSGWPSSTGVFIIKDNIPDGFNANKWVNDMQIKAGQNREWIEYKIVSIFRDMV